MMTGRKIIRAEYLPAIASALGVEIWELFAPADVVDEVRKGRGR